MGSSFWAFESLGLAPDMVSMGKSIGNGHPMAALVCTAGVADSFDNGMEYFNSCAGTNTAAAVGMAVMDCIEQQVRRVVHRAQKPRGGSFSVSRAAL